MTTFNCTACDYANREGVRFCEGCGTSLAPRCPSCGAELPVTARFCGECGSPIEGDPVTAAPGALKVVTVVFSDLIGSTSFQESLDTESVRRVMARFYQVMRGVVERHQGTLEKFIGDAVVAVFGTPLVREDDALRAVRCAAAMAQELQRLNEELDQAWGCGCGPARASTPASS
jgi:class 3 adenylate cyclase